MFLKRLDVIGFKSFADRLSIDFTKGVTAVVGPNGSGKSNVIDAIRWVLGEQSAKSLRGARMEDVIFNGSDGRKRLNVAEVTLTLDNSDESLPLLYQEISVTRKLYRSGESEYYINKQACRLKDIIDLFMDTGIGKEAYSIIGQGKIDEILSSKPEDRRTIFEEAAGVLKYKIRRKKAEQKLLETKDNLLRVEDILIELSSQIEPLRIQSSMAKDYLIKKEELEQIEGALIVHEIDSFQSQWEEAKRSLEKQQDGLLQFTSDVQKREADVETKRDHLEALDESITAVQDVLLEVSSKLEKLAGQKQLLHERTHHASNNRQTYEQMISENEAKIQDLSEQIKSSHKQLLECKEKVHQFEQELHTKQTQFDFLSENLDEKLEALKNDYFDLMNEQTSLKNEQRYLNEQEKQNEVKSKRVDDEFSKLALQKKQLSDQISKLKEEKETLENKRVSLSNDLHHLQDEKVNTIEQYEKQKQQLYKAYQYIEQYKSRKQTIEEMKEDYAGFYQGVKEVLKAKTTLLKGIGGAVAELLTVPKEYETALDIALGASLQYVVTETEENARSAIAFLKQHRYGRATFLPLSVIKPRTISNYDRNIAMQSESFVGVASELVSVDEHYAPIVHHLLGQLIVATDLKGANELAKRLNYRYRIVTVEGDIVTPGGAMTGGSVKQKAMSLLGRNRELDDLTDKIKQMAASTEKLEHHLKELKQSLDQIETKQKELGQDGQLINGQLEKLSKQLSKALNDKHLIEEKQSLYTFENKDFLLQKETHQKRISEITKDLLLIETKAKQIEQELDALTRLKQKQDASKAELQSSITELKVQIASQKQKLISEKDKWQSLTNEHEKAKQAIKQAQENLSLIGHTEEETEQNKKQLEKQIDQTSQEKEATIELITKRRAERLAKQDELAHEEEELKEIKRQMKQQSMYVHETEVKMNRLDVELENRLQLLNENYHLTFEAAKEKYVLTLDPADARKRVKLLSRSIEELGAVNIGAIEEYERVSERHQFLLEQKEDLEEAEGTLLKVIDEMDEEVKRRFYDAYTLIRGHFQTVFTELFEGGKADLVMTNEEDLLHSGVEIVAQPPGKKRQNLGLLSGGERALTAIALLFAILRYRATPFCILDEVEAALDEANVSRFSRYVKQFSEETQFIVITHRKGTMEQADVLYGVTMQELGVSSVMSVKLEDSDQFAEPQMM